DTSKLTAKLIVSAAPTGEPKMKEFCDRCGVPLEDHSSVLCIADDLNASEMSESEEAAWSGGSHPSQSAPTGEPQPQIPEDRAVSDAAWQIMGRERHLETADR